MFDKPFALLKRRNMVPWKPVKTNRDLKLKGLKVQVTSDPVYISTLLCLSKSDLIVALVTEVAINDLMAF